MKKKVLISRKIFKDTLSFLSKHFETVINNSDIALTKKELKKKLSIVDGAQIFGNDIIDEEIIKNCPNLKIISNTAVGFNNIDVDCCTKHNIFVCNTPGVLDDTVADHAIGLTIDACRRISEGDRYIRNKNWKKWSFNDFLGVDIHGAKFGIYGFGRIGQKIAYRLKGFNAKIYYHSRNKVDEKIEKSLNARYLNKEQILKKSDILICILPYDESTHHVISHKELSLMKETSIIINMARGGIINDKALINALKGKKLFGAGLDVYENEPKLNSEFLKLENVVLSPHIGSASLQTRKRMVKKAGDNLYKILNGLDPENVLNLKNIKNQIHD